MSPGQDQESVVSFFHHTKAFSDPFRIIYTFALMSVRNLRWKRLLYWGSAVAEAYVEFSGRLMLEISWRLWSQNNLLLLSLVVCLLEYILDICTEICTSSATSDVLSMIINNELQQQWEAYTSPIELHIWVLSLLFELILLYTITSPNQNCF